MLTQWWMRQGSRIVERRSADVVFCSDKGVQPSLGAKQLALLDDSKHAYGAFYSMLKHSINTNMTHIRLPVILLNDRHKTDQEQQTA